MEGMSNEIFSGDDRGSRSALGEYHSDGDGSAKRALSPSTARFALGLGIFGLGLGLAEVLAPRRLNRLAGVSRRGHAHALTRALGLREILSGVGLIGRRRPAPWLWARVAGDAIDLALLGAAARRKDARVDRLVGTIATVVGVTALDIYAAAKSTGRERTKTAKPVRRAITVAATPDQAYRYWRELKNMPAFMERISAVQELDGRRSRWEARAPLGQTISWEAEITEDRPNESLRWRSVADAPVANAGAVTFRAAPGRRGTEICVELSYVPPAGELGRAASFLTNPTLGVQLERDLRRLKQVLELGEIVKSDASIHRGPHPAQPAQS
jgi:uncharacterized membrane protein